MHANRLAVRHRDARRLLAPMLEREHSEIGDVGDVDAPRRADPEHPTHLADESSFPRLPHLRERQPKLSFELDRLASRHAEQRDLDVVAAR